MAYPIVAILGEKVQVQLIFLNEDPLGLMGGGDGMVWYRGLDSRRLWMSCLEKPGFPNCSLDERKQLQKVNIFLREKITDLEKNYAILKVQNDELDIKIETIEKKS